MKCFITLKQVRISLIYAGCDTETYIETHTDDKTGIEIVDCKGLKSIQLVTDNQEYYFIASDYSQSDESIRYEICDKFFDLLLNSSEDMRIAFFNLTFDSSQFLYYMIAYSGLSINYDDNFRIRKNELSFLETDRKVYSISFRNHKGKVIKMIDLANFAVATKLDDVAKSWIGKEKIVIESKIFPKRQPTKEELNYAMQDARLTLEIYHKFLEENVIEYGTVTIAGRTIRHFRDFCKKEYRLSLEKLLFLTDDENKIQEMKDIFEAELRHAVRGGICQAWQKGVFEHVTHIDARSMYPTQCVKNLYPCGALLNEPPKNERYTSILYPSGWYILKENKIPCVQWSSKANCERYAYLRIYEPAEYVKDFFLDGSYAIWQDEYDIIKQQYTVINEKIDKKWYIRMRDNVVLKDYVNKLYDGKRNNTGAKRLYYKYLLNALYGKFLTRPDGMAVTYVYESESWQRIKIATEKQTYYLPLGMWIAMQGRVTLMKAIISLENQNRDFIYCDTDSIVFKGNFPDIEIGKELGQWGIEQSDVSINVIGPKTYQEKTADGEIITKCAGMPTALKDKVEWLGLYDGLTIPCTKPRRDKNTWAINIEPTYFTVSAKAQIFKRG